MSENTALTLPDEDQFRKDITAINKFQQIVHANMIAGADYGVIPGTQKPSLLKPGAEKITKLLGLADQYDILDKQEDWSKPFFRYLIKCSLVSVVSGTVISEGLGECNSMESKYRWRWVGERDLPPGIDPATLVSQERHSKTGGRWTVYRLENEDIYSQVNTILKMAKKRSLVDAALSAGRLSNVFTQDIEDLAPVEDAPQSKSSPPKAKSSSVAPPKVEEAGSTLRDIPTITTFSELYKACSEDFTVKGKPMQPYQVIAELGVSSQSEVSDTPAECYQKLRAVREDARVKPDKPDDDNPERPLHDNPDDSN